MEDLNGLEVKISFLKTLKKMGISNFSQEGDKLSVSFFEPKGRNKKLESFGDKLEKIKQKTSANLFAEVLEKEINKDGPVEIQAANNAFQSFGIPVPSVKYSS